MDPAHSPEIRPDYHDGLRPPPGATSEISALPRDPAEPIERLAVESISARGAAEFLRLHPTRGKAAALEDYRAVVSRQKYYDFDDAPRTRVIDGLHLLRSLWDDAKVLWNLRNIIREHRQGNLRFLAGFGSARLRAEHPAYKQACEIGRLWVERDPRNAIITGGGPGIMAATNCGAFEAGRKNVTSLGIKIKLGLAHEQHPNEFLTHLVELRYFPNRRAALEHLSDVVTLLRGGYGTLDEGFEAFELFRLGYEKQIMLVDRSFWGGFHEYLVRHEREHGLLGIDPNRVYSIVDRAQECVDLAQRRFQPRPLHEVPVGVKASLRHSWEMLRAMQNLHFIGPCVFMTGSEHASAPVGESSSAYGLGGVWYRKMSEIAFHLSRADAGQGPVFNVLTFGRNGLDRAANEGASVPVGEGKVKGLSIGLSFHNHEHSDVLNDKLDRSLHFSSLSAMMVMAAKYSPVIVLGPGDFRTFKMLFEVATGLQTGKMKNRLIVLLGKEYWEPLIHGWCREQLWEKNRTIDEKDLHIPFISDDVGEIVRYVIRESQERRLLDRFYRGPAILPGEG